MIGDFDNREYSRMMLDAGREELVEASAHLQTALGHFVAANDVKRVSWLSVVWYKLHDILESMGCKDINLGEDESPNGYHHS